MQDKPVVIFDFDGTIADSFLTMLQILYELVHHQPLPPENITELRAHGTLTLLRELHIPLWRAIGLLPRLQRRLNKADAYIAPIAGMPEAIHQLSATHRLFILSASGRKGIDAFLARHNLQHYFERVYDDAVAWHKAPCLRQVIRDQQLQPAKAWYIGDRTWDVRAAHAVGMRAAAVTWGFNNTSMLSRTHPEIVVSNPRELVGQLQEYTA